MQRHKKQQILYNYLHQNSVNNAVYFLLFVTEKQKTRFLQKHDYSSQEVKDSSSKKDSSARMANTSAKQSKNHAKVKKGKKTHWTQKRKKKGECLSVKKEVAVETPNNSAPSTSKKLLKLSGNVVFPSITTN